MGRLWAGGAVLSLALAASPARGGSLTYTVDPAASSVRILVGKSGLFSFAGHTHEVVAPSLGGEILADPEDLAVSSVSLSFDALALRVTGKGDPPDDVPKVQQAMLGPKVLDVARFPVVTFRSRRVAGREVSPGVYELTVTGEMSLHGVSRGLGFEVRAEASADGLVASGRAVLKHTDFGMKPVSVAGVVNVKNEITVDFRIVGRSAPP